MVVFPNAKINLGLNIKYKRSDGFHELETIMLPIALNDVLEILPANKIELFESGFALDNASIAHNLVYKSWALLKKQFDIPPVAIYLHKNIPSGAGLGGGSADAAFAISLLNELFELKLSVHEMEEQAAMLGSDCAFFIRNVPALATGRGERLSRATIDLHGKYLLLVVPDVHVSTAEAYQNVQPAEWKKSLKSIISQPLDTWREDLKNDFEASVFPHYPELAHIKENLYAHGAFYAAMSGSGSAVFGLFDEEPEPFTYTGARLIETIFL